MDQKIKSVEDLNNNIYKKLLESKEIKKKINDINAKGKMERDAVKTIISKLWTKYVSLNGDKIQKIINNITNSKKIDNTNNLAQFKVDLKKEIDTNVETTEEQIKTIIKGMKGVETESYKNYINKLGELMIKNKKTELNKLNEIGNKVILLR